MNKDALIKLIQSEVKVGMAFDNPGGGTSTVVSINSERIVYRRRNSRLYLKFKDFADVYELFIGKKCSTNDIKSFNPQVFCSGDNGHGCHCTFIFIILNYLKLTQNGICGRGKPGDPFYVNVS